MQNRAKDIRILVRIVKNRYCLKLIVLEQTMDF